MKYDVITIGSVMEDIMFHTDDLQIIKNPKKLGSRKLFAFEAGDKIIADERVLHAVGGGGANVAVSFARLGLKTLLLGAVGSDPSSLKLSLYLKKEKVDVSKLQVIKNSWSGVSFILTAGKKNDHIIFLNRAANEKLKLQLKQCLLLKSKWFYLASLTGEFWKHNLDVIFASAVKNKIKVAWNPGSIQLNTGVSFLKKYLKQTYVLTMNREEAIELVKTFGKETTSIKELSKIISSFGPKIVSISDGARGAYIYSAGQYKFEKALPFIAVNTTGAGDAFGSSLVGGLILYDGDLEQALKLAILRSNYVVREIGAQVGLLTLGEVEAKNKRG